MLLRRFSARIQLFFPAASLAPPGEGELETAKNLPFRLSAFDQPAFPSPINPAPRRLQPG